MGQLGALGLERRTLTGRGPFINVINISSTRPRLECGVTIYGQRSDNGKWIEVDDRLYPHSPEASTSSMRVHASKQYLIITASRLGGQRVLPCVICSRTNQRLEMENAMSPHTYLGAIYHTYYRSRRLEQLTTILKGKAIMDGIYHPHGHARSKIAEVISLLSDAATNLHENAAMKRTSINPTRGVRLRKRGPNQCWRADSNSFPGDPDAENGEKPVPSHLVVSPTADTPSSPIYSGDPLPDPIPVNVNPSMHGLAAAANLVISWGHIGLFVLVRLFPRRISKDHEPPTTEIFSEAAADPQGYPTPIPIPRKNLNAAVEQIGLDEKNVD
ncbi:hypothetical protein F5146DRAFT_1144084 [Armillaria mellea]|nr:hypothetical protein F5146DRAFT_1144084 [Armillaria mellea]